MTREELAALKPDWDSYGAPAPTPESIDLAFFIADMARNQTGLPPASIVASCEGGVAACFVDYDSALYGDIECFNDGTMLAIVSPDAHVWPVEMGEIAEAIAAIAKHFTERAPKEPRG